MLTRRGLLAGLIGLPAAAVATGAASATGGLARGGVIADGRYYLVGEPAPEIICAGLDVRGDRIACEVARYAAAGRL